MTAKTINLPKFILQFFLGRKRRNTDVATFFMLLFMLIIFCNLNAVIYATLGLANLTSPIILVCSFFIYSFLPTKQNYFGKPFLGLAGFLIAFTVIGILSLIYNLHHHQFTKAEELLEIRKNFTAMIILFIAYIYCVWSLRNVSDIFILKLVFYFFFTTLLIGLLSPHIGLNELLSEGENTHRVYGLFANPNENGFQANLTILLAYFLFLKRSIKILPFIGIATFCIYGAFASFSKTAMITMVFILGLFILYVLWRANSFNKSFRVKVMTSFFLLSISLSTLGVYFSNNGFTMLHPVQKERISEAMAIVLKGKFDRATTTNRSLLYERGLKKIAAQPFFGYGLGTFSCAGMVHVWSGVHNMYLKIWGEAGIFVFLFFLLLLGYYTLIGFSLIKEPEGFLLLSFLLAFGIFSFSSHSAFSLKYLMGFIGIILGVTHEINRRKYLIGDDNAVANNIK